MPGVNVVWYPCGEISGRGPGQVTETLGFSLGGEDGSASFSKRSGVINNV